MPIRRGVLLLIITISALITFAVLAAPRHESLARSVPANVGLFIEGQRIDDLIVPLIEPQTWLALAELAGQPARLEEATEWQNRIRQALKMEPAEAVKVLFAEQFAFIGEGLGRSQDAVVLCRPATEPRRLLQRWGAQPLPTASRTSVYRLGDGIGVAVPDGLILFGDAEVPGGMFGRMLELADGRPDGTSLAEDPAYKSLLARIPERPDAVLFARLRRPPSSAPASAPATISQPAGSRPTTRAAELPGPLRGASNIMLALHRDQQLLRFSVVGDGRGDSSRAGSGLLDMVSHLPERTLMTWGFHLDYAQLPKMLEQLPPRSILRLMFSMQQRSGIAARLIATLDSATCVALGLVEPDSRAAPAPPLPALAVLIDAQHPEEAEDELETLLEQSMSFYGLMALKAGSKVVQPRIQRLELENADVGLLDVSGFLQGQSAAVISELHICWALDGGTLIVASHLDWLRQILAARHGEAPPLANTLNLGKRPIPRTTETVIAVQTGPVADLGGLWLNYFKQAAPQILSEGWWQAQQPGRNNVHLGINVTELGDEQRLRVTAVEADAPADGILRPGDEIVGYAGDKAAPNAPRRFATSQPIREMRRAIEARADARWLDVLIERGGTPVLKRIPLPFVDPIQILRRAVALGQIAQRVVYHEDVPDESGARGFLTIEPRGNAAPLFEFSLTPPAAPPDEAPAAAPRAPSDAAPSTPPVTAPSHGR